MKRSFLSLVLLTPVVMAFGQRHWGSNGSYTTEFFNAERGTDTIWAVSGDLTIYASGSGFVVGNNNYEDKAKAQAFVIGGEVVIDELLFFFGGKVGTSGDPNSKVVAHVWEMDGMGTASSGDAPCPGTSVAQADISFDAVDTTGEFTSALVGPVTMSSFAVGFDVTTLAAGDTVGLASTEFGTSSSADASWELWSDDTWHTFADPTGWGDDLDLAIAVVLTPVVGIEEAPVNGMKMTMLNGNVVNDQLDMAISFDKAVKAGLLVHDATGRLVSSQQLGNRAAGQHNISVDMSGMGAGQYYVTLMSNGAGLSKKVVKN